MLGRLLGLIWTLVKLPVKLVLLPFKVVSMVFSIVFYLLVLALLGGVVYLFVL